MLQGIQVKGCGIKMEELFILREEEFQILATAIDFTDVYGICTVHAPDEASVLYAIHEMVQKGILEKTEEGFCPAPVYRTAFSNMKAAKKILSVTGKEEETADVCFYIGDKLISLEESRQDKNAVRIGIFERSELRELLSERGFLPKSFWEQDIGKLQKAGELPFEGETVFAQYVLFCPPEKKQEPYKSFWLLQNGCDYRIVEKDGEAVGYAAYGTEDFWACLEHSLGMKEG